MSANVAKGRHLVSLAPEREPVGDAQRDVTDDGARSRRAAELAARLRQAVQGCTLHLHGPVQGWWAVEQAVQRGEVSRDDVVRAAVGASERRLAQLREQGVGEQDPRVRKEIITARFMARLFGGATDA